MFDLIVKQPLQPITASVNFYSHHNNTSLLCAVHFQYTNPQYIIPEQFGSARVIFTASATGNSWSLNKNKSRHNLYTNQSKIEDHIMGHISTSSATIVINRRKDNAHSEFAITKKDRDLCKKIYI